MGYTTEFTGEVQVTPPLSPQEVQYLNAFSASRRMHRRNGPYFCGDRYEYHSPDVLDSNQPPPGQPGLWCQWVAAPDGTAIQWDGGEKFYASSEWMQYLIKHFFGFNAIAKHDFLQTQNAFKSELGGLFNEVQLLSLMFQFFHPVPELRFLQGDHWLNGRIEAQGEDPADRWDLVVVNNVVREETRPRPLRDDVSLEQDDDND